MTTNWAEGNFSILHVIPAIGTKFDLPAALGPQSEPHPAAALPFAPAAGSPIFQ